VSLTNAEKQARYRERYLGVGGEKVRVGLNLNTGGGPMMRPCASGSTVHSRSLTEAEQATSRRDRPSCLTRPCIVPTPA
jgi:hypothetical protein